MASEKITLMIKAERLGTVTEVKNFLSDLENAYNSIYVFDYLLVSISADRERVEERLYRMREYWKEYPLNKDFHYNPFFSEMFWKEYILKQQNPLPSLLELQSKIDIERFVLPSDRLILSKVNINSPGFWEFIGGLNPMEQIREYLKDRHERKKDNMYRNRQEEERGELDIEEKRTKILGQKIETLKNAGYTEVEIRQLVMEMVFIPLKRLDKYQDNGQIETPE